MRNVSQKLAESSSVRPSAAQPLTGFQVHLFASLSGHCRLSASCAKTSWSWWTTSLVLRSRLEAARQQAVSLPSLSEMFRRLIRRRGQEPVARTVEVFGWLILVEGVLIVSAPHLVTSVLKLPDLVGHETTYLRLAGVLVSGVGMLYVVSARLNARGFVFATLLDRPLVPLVMGIMWYLGVLPGALALTFSIQDF